MQRETEKLKTYLKTKGLNDSRRRQMILGEFLNTERHLSAEELYELVKKKDPNIGLATVFRALKIFVDSGLAQKVKFSDKTIKYEHKFNHNHHDHIICESCGKIVEFFDPKIELLQKTICRKNGFLINTHRLDIFGVCSACAKKVKNETISN